MRFFNRLLNSKIGANLAVISAGTVAIEGFKKWAQTNSSYKLSSDADMEAFPHLKDIDSLINQAFHDMGTVKPDIYYKIKPMKIVEVPEKPASFEDNVYYIVTQSQSFSNHPDIQGWPCLVKRPLQPLDEKFIALRRENGSYQDAYTPATSETVRQFLLGFYNFSSAPISVQSSLFTSRPRVLVDGLITTLPPEQIYANAGHEAVHHMYKHDSSTSLAFATLLRMSYNFLNARNLPARFLIIYAAPPIQLLLTHTLQLAHEIQADIESAKRLNTANPLMNSLRVFSPMQSKRWTDKISDPHLTPERRIDYLSRFTTTSQSPLLFQSPFWHELKQRKASQSVEEQAIKNCAILYGS